MAKNSATAADFIRIHEFVRDKIRPTGPGECEYIDGWDDQRVADEIKCNRHSVTTVRKQMFGNVKGRTWTNIEALRAAIKSDIANLEKAVQALEQASGELNKRLGTIETRLKNKGYRGTRIGGHGS